MASIEEIKNYLIQNPTCSTALTAKKFNKKIGYIRSLKARLRKSGEMAKMPEGYVNGQTNIYFNQHAALEKECKDVGVPIESVNHYWYKGEHFSIFSKTKQVNYDTIVNDLIGKMDKYCPKYPTVKYGKIKDGHLLVIDPADLHIGKLCKAFETGDEYNHEIAINRIREGVQGLINKSSGFPIEKILFIIGNDILHVDNAKSSTTSGTHQDTDLMWYDAFNMALQIYVETIEKLAAIAPVYIQYDPSNHDYLNGFFLANTIKAWFRNHKSITMNVAISHRKYYIYGKNLIGTTHGDGAKESDLPLLMAHEAKEHWSISKHRYFFIHHIHHKKSKDYMGVCVESLRSASGTDSWHHRNGYQHAPKAIEGFIHHPEHGQVARLTHLF